MVLAEVKSRRWKSTCNGSSVKETLVKRKKTRGLQAAQCRKEPLGLGFVRAVENGNRGR